MSTINSLVQEAWTARQKFFSHQRDGPTGWSYTHIHMLNPHYHVDMQWLGPRHMSTHNNNLANPTGPRSSCVHTKGCTNALQARLRRCSCCYNSTNCKVLSNSCGHSK